MQQELLARQRQVKHVVVAHPPTRPGELRKTYVNEPVILASSDFIRAYIGGVAPKRLKGATFGIYE